MNPEKEILNWWLHSKGFFTMNSIRVARNKEVDTFAIRLDDGKLKEAIHIETAISITGGDTFSQKDYESKFHDAAVTAKVKELIEDFVGEREEYKRILVLGKTRTRPQLKSIEILDFEQVLADVLLHLDKQNYRNTVIRTLQIHKYILMANPDILAVLLKDSGNQKILKTRTRERFLSALFAEQKTQRIMGKEIHEDAMVSMLKTSSLTKPERLADALLTKVLTPRTRRRFIQILLEHKESKSIAKQIMKPKGVKTLQFFLKK
ncbi:MAG: hypothetical protein ABIH34_03095 [Nanoarchaeota archaeon]